MPKNIYKAFVFAYVVLVSGVSSASKEDSINPESLIAQARKLEEIWTDGTPPIAMRTEIQVFDAKGKVTTGQYNVNWVSPSRWREEVSKNISRNQRHLRSAQPSPFGKKSFSVESIHLKPLFHRGT